MDSRDSSIDIDEARPLNSNGDRVDPRPASITPPEMEYSSHARSRQLTFSLITILRCLIVIFTFANIVTQLISEPYRGTDIFLIVWDFFILIGNLAVLVVRACSSKTNNKNYNSCTFGVTLGDRTYYLVGGPRRHDYTFISDHSALASRRGRILTRVASFIIEISLVAILLAFSLISVNAGRYWSRYELYKNAKGIEILHYIVAAFMFILLLVRILSVHTGATVSLKLSLDDNEKSGIQLPDDEEVPRGL